MSAQDVNKGYRGFVEWNMELGFVDRYSSGDKAYSLYGLSTTHGYQFNSHFFLGAGVWIQRAIGEVQQRFEFPLFLQARTDWSLGKMPVFADLRVGGTLSARSIGHGKDKLFISPTIGYRLNWGQKVCANFGIGASFHGCDDGLMGAHYTWKVLPAVRLGIEF